MTDEKLQHLGGIRRALDVLASDVVARCYTCGFQSKVISHSTAK